ncbi:hypothetical protein HDV00_008985 [Rhizophlyctis rosea]|nr:hypothetical protein HDV00_008985 [Rhizophlyctis rosea]
MTFRPPQTTCLRIEWTAAQTKSTDPSKVDIRVLTAKSLINSKLDTRYRHWYGSNTVHVEFWGTYTLGEEKPKAPVAPQGVPATVDLSQKGARAIVVVYQYAAKVGTCLLCAREDGEAVKGWHDPTRLEPIVPAIQVTEEVPPTAPQWLHRIREATEATPPSVDADGKNGNSGAGTVADDTAAQTTTSNISDGDGESDFVVVDGQSTPSVITNASEDGQESEEWEIKSELIDPPNSDTKVQRSVPQSNQITHSALPTSNDDLAVDAMMSLKTDMSAIQREIERIDDQLQDLNSKASGGS